MVTELGLQSCPRTSGPHTGSEGRRSLLSTHQSDPIGHTGTALPPPFIHLHLAFPAVTLFCSTELASPHILSSQALEPSPGSIPIPVLPAQVSVLPHHFKMHLNATAAVKLLQSAAHQAPPCLGFSRQEHWSGLPFPSLMHESEK